MVGIVQQVEANRGVKRPKVLYFYFFNDFFFLGIFDLI